MAIELCEFLSDNKHPENREMLGDMTALLLNERRHAKSEHRRYMFEKNQALCKAIEQRKRELFLAKVSSVQNMIEERNKQIANGTLAEDKN